MYDLKKYNYGEIVQVYLRDANAYENIELLTAIREGTRKRIASKTKTDLIAKDSPTDLLV